MDKIDIDWGVVFNYSPKELIEVLISKGMDNVDIGIIYLFIGTLIIMIGFWYYNAHIYVSRRGRVPKHTLGHIELGFVFILLETGFAWWFFLHPFTRAVHWEPIQYWVHLVHDYKGEGLEWVALLASFFHIDFSRHIYVTLKRER